MILQLLKRLPHKGAGFNFESGSNPPLVRMLLSQIRAEPKLRASFICHSREKSRKTAINRAWLRRAEPAHGVSPPEIGAKMSEKTRASASSLTFLPRSPAG